MEIRRNPAIIKELMIKKEKLDITYPKVEGLKHRSVQKKINSIIKNQIYRMLKEQGYEQNGERKFFGCYDIKLNLRGLLSVMIEVKSSEEGRKNELISRKCLNISLRDSRIFSIQDLFRGKRRYILIINDKIKRQIKESKLEVKEGFSGIGKEPDYYLTEDELVIYFQPGEYTPKDAGIPEFRIEHQELGSTINEKGPIGKLMRIKNEKNAE